MLLRMGLAFISLVWVSPGLAQKTELQGSISRIGDATHLEFSGATEWNYELKKEINASGDAHLVLLVPPISNKTIAQLKTWKDSLVSNIEIRPEAVNGMFEIRIPLQEPSIDSFDYITDQPSRLVIDIFKSNKPDQLINTEIVKKPELPKRLDKTLPPKKPPVVRGRKPAGTEMIQVDTNANKAQVQATGTDERDYGIFDGADPKFERFIVKDHEIRPESIASSDHNIYIYFPTLTKQAETYQKLQTQRPEYEIRAKDSLENKQARLLLTLFKNKRYGLFHKTYQHFKSQYPASEYTELIEYLKADIAYEAWEQKNKPDEFEKAISTYYYLATKFPESPLAERTLLFIGNAYKVRGDHLNSLKILQSYMSKYPQSEYRKEVEFSIADSFLELNRFEDALSQLQAIEENAKDNSVVIEASYRKGDVHFKSRNFNKAIEAYEAANKKFPQAVHEFPSAIFNLAESQFWLGQYEKAIESHRKFLETFPNHSFGGYAMTRIGEIMEIFGVDEKRAIGSYLESYFRYGGESSELARIRLIGLRLKSMKASEVQKAVDEVTSLGKNSKLDRVVDFSTVVVSDGYYGRGEFDKSIKLLSDFYQRNSTSSNLEVFQKRIVRNIAAKMAQAAAQNDFMSVLKIHSKYRPNWLKGSKRIDTQFYVAQAYEQAGVVGEAEKTYRAALNQLYSQKGTSYEVMNNQYEYVPTPETLNLRLAAVEFERGADKKAYEYLQAIKNTDNLRDDEKIERVQLMAGVAEARGSFPEAAEYLTRLTEAWKGRPELLAKPYLQLAQLQHKLKKSEIAKQYIARLEALNQDTKKIPIPIMADALTLKAEIALKENKVDDAITTYQELFAKYDPQNRHQNLRYRLGELLFKKGQKQQAEQVWAQLQNNAKSPNAPPGIWDQLARENKSDSEWRDNYGKYLDRIPAMANQGGQK